MPCGRIAIIQRVRTYQIIFLLSDVNWALAAKTLPTFILWLVWDIGSVGPYNYNDFLFWGNCVVLCRTNPKQLLTKLKNCFNFDGNILHRNILARVGGFLV